MDLGTYLLDSLVATTASPNETAAAAGTRREAIVEMVQAYCPANAMEGIIVCHCVMLQFLLNGAVRDASNLAQSPAGLAKARAGVISMSRTLLQWVTKFENTRKRNEARAAQAEEQAQTQAAPVPVPKPAADRGSPVTPPYRPMLVPADRLDIPSPPPNGRAPAAVTPHAAGLSPPNGSRPNEPTPAPAIALGDQTLRP